MTTIATISDLFANLAAIRADLAKMGAQSFEFNLDIGRVLVSGIEVKAI